VQFEIHSSDSPTQPYYWKIVSGSNTLATSETYHNKADAERACESVKRNASTAPIVDKTTTASRRW
jgi:uncharacterized protein YegP (UPF0339 family)